jgi:hypothetical protein
LTYIISYRLRLPRLSAYIPFSWREDSREVSWGERLGQDARSDCEPLPITSSKSALLWQALCRTYEILGFDDACRDDEVFRQLVFARIIEPTSKADSLRVIAETGVQPVSYPTLNRRLSVFAKPGFRQALSAACATHARLGSASLVLYDVSTLHFETMPVTGFASPAFSNYAKVPVMPSRACRWT